VPAREPFFQFVSYKRSRREQGFPAPAGSPEEKNPPCAPRRIGDASKFKG